MLRSATYHIFPVIKQVTKCGLVIRSLYSKYAVVDVCTCSSWDIERRLLPAASSSSSWQQGKQLQKPYKHYHSPFTLSRMTSGNIFHPSDTTLGVASLPLWSLPDTSYKNCRVRLYSTKPPSVPSSADERLKETKTLTSREDDKAATEAQGVSDDNNKDMSLVQKFKLMYQQYWYVLIPVHLVTSVVWYGSFFIAAKSGVDIVPLLETLGAGEKILSHLQKSDAGYYAIAYALYKIATPARYTVTIGGTTLSINYLKKRGYIRPVPSSEKLKEMYEGKKEEFIERKEEMVGRYQEKKGEMVDKYQERKEEMVEKYQEKKSEMVQRVSVKRDELKGKVSEKRDEIKGRIEEQKEKLGSIRDSMRKRSCDLEGSYIKEDLQEKR
ncbi:uncharacterized protein C18orf19 homolog A isoform X2 [Procambarus clarkii]|uniref:uncharacterized protein C18orf19 homolog A isoform X2 n=1 Tax=Procambarus clarkii TaxID=6728 RepID=UPI003742BEF2